MSCTTICLMEWKQARSSKRNDKPGEVSHLSFHYLMSSQNTHRGREETNTDVNCHSLSDPLMYSLLTQHPTVLLKQTRKVISSMTQEPGHSFNQQASPRIQLNQYNLSTLGWGQCYRHRGTQGKTQGLPWRKTQGCPAHTQTIKQTLNAHGGKGQMGTLKGTDHTMP